MYANGNVGPHVFSLFGVSVSIHTHHHSVFCFPNCSVIYYSHLPRGNLSIQANMDIDENTAILSYDSDSDI